MISDGGQVSPLKKGLGCPLKIAQKLNKGPVHRIISTFQLLLLRVKGSTCLCLERGKKFQRTMLRQAEELKPHSGLGLQFWAILILNHKREPSAIWKDKELPHRPLLAAKCTQPGDIYTQKTARATQGCVPALTPLMDSAEAPGSD